MIPRFQPTLNLQDLAAVIGKSSSEDAIHTFERAFAETIGAREAIAFPYGRTGLLALLSALDLQGREIICPAYTCVVVAHAIVKSGNIPVFIDSDATCNMDLDQLETAITKRTGAIIATSIFGHPVDLNRLDQLQALHPDIHIIQDCAHSYGAEWANRPVTQHGCAAIYGLNISKIMTSVFGGMVTTDSPQLANTLRKVRSHLLTKPSASKIALRFAYACAIFAAFSPVLYRTVNRLERAKVLDRFVKYYDESQIDMPDDHTDSLLAFEARVGTNQVRRYPAFLEARRAYASFYREQLTDIPALVFPTTNEGMTYSHIVAAVANREKIVELALQQGIQLGTIINYSIPEMKAYQPYRQGQEFPNSKLLSKSMVNLPLGGNFSQERAERVVDGLRKILESEPVPTHPLFQKMAQTAPPTA